MPGAVLFSCRTCRVMHVVIPAPGHRAACAICTDAKVRTLCSIPPLRIERSSLAHMQVISGTVSHF